MEVHDIRNARVSGTLVDLTTRDWNGKTFFNAVIEVDDDGYDLLGEDTVTVGLGTNDGGLSQSVGGTVAMRISTSKNGRGYNLEQGSIEGGSTRSGGSGTGGRRRSASRQQTRSGGSGTGGRRSTATARSAGSRGDPKQAIIAQQTAMKVASSLVACPLIIERLLPAKKAKPEQVIETVQAAMDQFTYNAYNNIIGHEDFHKRMKAQESAGEAATVDDEPEFDDVPEEDDFE